MALFNVYRNRLSVRHLPACAALCLAAACAGALASAVGSGKPPAAAAQERLHALLTQRYEFLQQMVKNARIQMESGRLEVPAYQELVAAMYRAQADLCPTAAERVQVYEKLVDFLAEQEKLLNRQAAAGRVTGIQMDQGKLVVWNARIDLERLRLGQAAAESLPGQ